MARPLLFSSPNLRRKNKKQQKEETTKEIGAKKVLYGRHRRSIRSIPGNRNSPFPPLCVSVRGCLFVCLFLIIWLPFAIRFITVDMVYIYFIFVRFIKLETGEQNQHKKKEKNFKREESSHTRFLFFPR
jgi:hypothetical protein